MVFAAGRASFDPRRRRKDYHSPVLTRSPLRLFFLSHVITPMQNVEKVGPPKTRTFFVKTRAVTHIRTVPVGSSRLGFRVERGM